MSNETTEIKKNIEQNKLVKFIKEDEYEPMSVRVYKKRARRLSYWLKYVGLALLFDVLGFLLDIYAETRYSTGDLGDAFIENVGRGFSLASLIFIVVAFVYLISARKKKLMKDIRADDLL